MQRMNLLALVLSVLVFASCKKDSQSHFSELPTEKTGFTSSDQLKLEFAKALGKAMTDPAVRTLLKEEALKRFDNDYDVLFQLVKDREVKPGVTLLSYLNSLASSNDAFNNLGEEAPLLTILVPHLSNFSAATWNTNDETPVVAIVKNDFEEKKHIPLVAFDQIGNQLSLESNKEPKRPVVVVKENERLMGVSTNTSNARAIRRNLVFANNSAAFFFSDDSFNGNSAKQLQTAFAIVYNSLVDPKLQQAYDLNAVSQRDYVYYNILNPNDQGELDHTYAEYLTSFAVNTRGALDNYLYDDPTSDWSDGDLEFQMDVMMFNGTGGLNKITKVFSIPRSSLITADGGVMWYSLPNPIMIATWDMKEMGSIWKYVVNEIDPGTVTTTTQTSTSKFGANWSVTGSAELEKIIKVGAGYGLTGEKSTTGTTTIQVTTGSDLCGEAVADFLQPAVTGKTNFGLPPKTYYSVNELNTGTVSLIVLPKKIL